MQRRLRSYWKPRVWIFIIFGVYAFFLGWAAGVRSMAADHKGKAPSAAKRDSPPGCPLAPGMMTLVEEEITSSLKQRGIDSAFARFTAYAGETLDRTAGTGWSELSGNCRLHWYDHLLRDPLHAPAEAEKFTRQLHEAVLGRRNWLDQALVTAGEKLDLKVSRPRDVEPVKSAEEALDVVKKALPKSLQAYRAAVASVSDAEVGQLDRQLYFILTEQTSFGHTLVDRGTGRQLLDIVEKLDRSSMMEAARELAPLTNKELLEELRKLPDKGGVAVEGAIGTIVRKIGSEAGDIVIGGKGKNAYDLDKMSGVAAVIDLGGDDEYSEGAVSLKRPLLVVIDLDGNDTYVAGKPGAQGGAVLGISMLLDLAGNDVYRARDVAQGSCLAGVGILVDYTGDDVYVGMRRVQGQAIGGVGLLIDRAGDDRYHAAMWAQGFGGPLGFGLLDDLAGEDHYFAGGLYPDTYPETPGYEGWAQGVGAGLRQVSNGGIGVILDGSGNDVYEFDYLSHGGGYWMGVGFARDFGGNDQRLGATRTAFDGEPRSQTRFQRFGTGWGCHYALGFCYDDAGDDSYAGNIMGLGFGWDLSVGVLCDFAGKDRYEATGQQTEGSGGQASLGIIFDYDGADAYMGPGQGYASPGISYHSMPTCGGNFGFVIDYGGKDEYGCGAQNNAYTVRGAQGGFVIDRPKEEELDAPTRANTKTKVDSVKGAKEGRAVFWGAMKRDAELDVVSVFG